MKAIIKERIEQIKQGIIPEGYKETKIGIIPEDWEVKKIGEITKKVGSGKTPKGGEKVYTESGIIFLRSQNILNGKLKIEEIKYISEDENAKMISTEVLENDLLLNITGASIGRSCVVPKNFPKANLNQHVCIIRLKEDINENFILNQILSPIVQNQIFSYQAGGNREGLNFEQIRKIKIINIELNEQEKIASILTKWDSLIEHQEKLVEYKKENKSFLLEKILSRKDSWDKIRIEKLVTESKDPGSTGKDAKKITVKLYGKGVYAKEEKSEGSENTKYFKRRKGQFIYSKLDFLNGAFGIIPEELDRYETTADLPTFDFNLERIEPKFFLEVVSRPAFYKKVGGNAIGSRKAVRVSQSEFLKSYFHLPSIEEQKKLVNLLSKLDEEILLQEEKLNLLKEEKKILMQLLLTGILRI